MTDHQCKIRTQLHTMVVCCDSSNKLLGMTWDYQQNLEPCYFSLVPLIPEEEKSFKLPQILLNVGILKFPCDISIDLISTRETPTLRKPRQKGDQLPFAASHSVLALALVTFQGSGQSSRGCLPSQRFARRHEAQLSGTKQQWRRSSVSPARADALSRARRLLFPTASPFFAGDLFRWRVLFIYFPLIQPRRASL